jgi:hypothetical protein
MLTDRAITPQVVKRDQIPVRRRPQTFEVGPRDRAPDRRFCGVVQDGDVGEVVIKGSGHGRGRGWTADHLPVVDGAGRRDLRAQPGARARTYSPSFYAENAKGELEDAADAIALYVLSKGSPAFAEYRAMMPARFALLDRLLSSR